MSQAAAQSQQPASSSTPAFDEAWFAARAQPGVQRLKAYDPGHDLVALRRRFGEANLAELGSNENPYGPSPAARQAILESLHALHRYPDPLGADLKRALAARHGVDVAQLQLGNGSHELLMQLAQVFAGPGDEVVFSRYGFAVFALATQCAGATMRIVEALPRDAAMPCGHDLDAIAAAIGPQTRLVYLANPNNPTGTWFGREAMIAFLERVPPQVIVVMDEAYAEMADAPDYASAVSLLDRYRNLAVTRTFSKAYGLAGLRVGYLIAQPGLIAVMDRARKLQRQRPGAGRVRGRARRRRASGLGLRAQRRAAFGPGRCADPARAAGVSVADQFRAGRIRRAHAADRSGPGRTRRDPAADGRLRFARLPAHQRRFAR
jgi:histidinol-phosphate aminotransferase